MKRIFSAPALCVVVPALLALTAQAEAPSAALKVSPRGSLEDCGCDSPLSDAADAVAQTAPANSVWLGTLDLSKMSVGWGQPHVDLSVDSHPLTIGGKVFPHGIGTHANSQLAVDVNGASKFAAMVGVDDESQGKGTVEFKVYADGKQVAQSGPMKGNDTPRLLSINLTGVKRLILRVTDGDDGMDYDHADWGGALLTYPLGVTPQPLAVVAPRIEDRMDDETPYPIARASVNSLYPVIHGARVTGATPGRPFLFRVPATGQMPLAYSAKNLPAGLALNAQTGLITGSLQNAGTTVVKLEVRNARGVTHRNLTIRAGADMLAQTPPMGWNSWNIYYCDVDEKKVRAAAAEILQTGLDKHGYQYVNIDDCWQGARDAGGNLQVNPKFGDLKALGDYLHTNGLKFGIYSSPGPQTCAKHEGSYNHEAQDVQSYANWGVDYLKYDWCSYGGVATGEGLERAKKPYRVMAQALNNAPRDIVYSLCQYGMDDVWKWGDDADIHGNLWRTTGDISPSYNSMRDIGFQQSRIAKYAGPGHWNDPDMLFMHALKPNEQLTHLTLWSMNAAPLLIGSDISKLSLFTLDALSNDEVIEIDQDPLGVAGTERKVVGTAGRIWARPLWDGTTAVALFNRGLNKMAITATWADLGLKGSQPVRDLWQQRDIGTHKNDVTLTVPAHGAILLKIGKPHAQDYMPQS